jgi:ubiquitin-protein ligase
MSLGKDGLKIKRDAKIISGTSNVRNFTPSPGDTRSYRFDLDTNSKYGTLSLEVDFPEGYGVAQRNNVLPVVRVTSPILHPEVDPDGIISVEGLTDSSNGAKIVDVVTYGRFKDIWTHVQNLFDSSNPINSPTEYSKNRRDCANWVQWDTEPSDCPEDNFPDEKFIRLANGECWHIDELVDYMIKNNYANLSPEKRRLWRDHRQLADITYHPGLNKDKRRVVVLEGLRLILAPFNLFDLMAQKPDVWILMAHVGWSVHTDWLGTGRDIDFDPLPLALKFYREPPGSKAVKPGNPPDGYDGDSASILLSKMVEDISPQVQLLSGLLASMLEPNCGHELGFRLLILYLKYHLLYLEEKGEAVAPLYPRVFQLDGAGEKIFFTFAWNANRPNFDHWYPIAIDLDKRVALRMLYQGSLVPSNFFPITPQNSHLSELIAARYGEIAKKVEAIEKRHPSYPLSPSPPSP